MWCLRGALGPPASSSRSSGLLGFERLHRSATSTRDRTQPETRLRWVVSKTTAPLQVTMAALSSSKTDLTRLVPARCLRAAKCSHSPLAIRVHFLCRNTPSAGRFGKYGTCLGDLGSPIFSEDGPHTTCTRLPLASGQTHSLTVRPVLARRLRAAKTHPLAVRDSS
jgi:hypothetical protein